ncbi:ATP-dependent Clp protease proteolytic subunit [Phyllobacterium leguminum]|uniref:ATP-dependent Clp protease protease subunit n=1 Tax=Phyllobacterium leguminum TaxID=314237 RepID=A0A318SZ95_9HYPH|nr:ATP-dependent Clp protease proteolytic subunit [Phyllobacterium leguminum]PYE86823.1 ATP-dependent Clp protease protease subunit [Phyllobacterium leguminum]
MRKLLPIIACATLLAGSAHSEVRYVLPDGKANLSGQDINIHFSGNITNQKIVDLESAIDRFNIRQPEAKIINLYINSYGGDMEAAWTGYAAIKSSKIPIRTINEAVTDSAGTLLYCAATQRYVMNGATFLLHPAAASLGSGNYKPDAISREAEKLKNANNYFLKAYTGCSNLSENDIQQMLKSEYTSKTFGDTEAVKIGLASEVLSVEYPGAASAYIFDADKSSG